MSTARNGPVVPVVPAPAVEGDGRKNMLISVGKSLAIFAAIQLATRYGAGFLGLKTNQPAPITPVVPDSSLPVSSTPIQTPLAPVLANQAWPFGTPVSMLLFTSVSPSSEDLDLASPVVAWDGLTYGSWKDQREVDLVLDVPESVRAGNGSWYMDIVLVKGGGIDLTGKQPNEIAKYRKPLTRFLPKRKVRKEKKLIKSAGDEEEVEDVIDSDAPTTIQPIIAHWSRNLTLTIVNAGGETNMAQIQPQLRPYYLLTPDEPKTYYPVVFPNDFWILRENMHPINETSHQLPLHLNYQALSYLKFSIFATMGASMEAQAAQPGTGGEMDEVKRMLTETNPILLITTVIVTMLHMLFEFLAFSSDVKHWRQKDKNLVGVSLRTILTNCFVQLVILLYLQDSSEETSLMILAGQGIGLLIEAWKITKVVDVRVRAAPDSIFQYRVTFEDKKVLSEDEKKTQEYDALAFRLVSYGAIPLLAGYTVYSLMYKTHRGWYSFVVTTLAQAIYMFGFVQLVPQLIINYKLKSVAHMPMKAMIYKTRELNIMSSAVWPAKSATFSLDRRGRFLNRYSAFVIPMPFLHRLACFRDDVVFLILLYQRWIYRIDPTRVNEYGQVVEGMAEPVGGDVVETKKDQ
ncbi:hypothetical protein P7C73_g4075, partial [Tremellales sp. Uapishka_1]